MLDTRYEIRAKAKKAFEPQSTQRKSIDFIGAPGDRLSSAANIKWKDARYEQKQKKHLNHRVHRGKASLL